MFLPQFDFLCDPIVNKRKATWNLFVVFDEGERVLIHVVARGLRLVPSLFEIFLTYGRPGAVLNMPRLHATVATW